MWTSGWFIQPVGVTARTRVGGAPSERISPRARSHYFPPYADHSGDLVGRNALPPDRTQSSGGRRSSKNHAREWNGDFPPKKLQRLRLESRAAVAGRWNRGKNPRFRGKLTWDDVFRSWGLRRNAFTSREPPRGCAIRPSHTKDGGFAAPSANSRTFSRSSAYPPPISLTRLTTPGPAGTRLRTMSAPLYKDRPTNRIRLIS